MKPKFVFLFLSILFLLQVGCFDTRVKRDLVLSRDFKAQAYPVLAVINLDPQIQFAQYVEAELLKRGYKVKDGGAVGQLLRREGFLKEGSLEAQSLPKIGDLLQVQGIVLCSVSEFSRFRDSYRLSIRVRGPPHGRDSVVCRRSEGGAKGTEEQ